MDFKNEMRAAYQQAYEVHPGLKRFDQMKKILLWGVIGIAAVQKILVIIPNFRPSSILLLFFSAIIGLCIPGIFALAAYRGPWKHSLIFYFLAVYLLFDVVTNGLPVLTAGIELPSLFYAAAAVESFYAVYLLLLALWLTVPAKNRSYADVLNSVFKDLGQKIRELEQTRRP